MIRYRPWLCRARSVGWKGRVGSSVAAYAAVALFVLAPSAQGRGISDALILGSAWCSYATNPSGTQTTLIFKFYPQGTYDLILRTVGYVSGPGGVLDISGDERVTRGRWVVVQGDLHMSPSLDTSLSLVATGVQRNGNGRLALVGPEGTSSQC